MVKVSFENESIMIERTKKGLFGTKVKNVQINLDEIEQLERVEFDGELASVNIHKKDFDIECIEKEECVDLEEIYKLIVDLREKIEETFPVVVTNPDEGTVTRIL